MSVLAYVRHCLCGVDKGGEDYGDGVDHPSCHGLEMCGVAFALARPLPKSKITDKCDIKSGFSNRGSGLTDFRCLTASFKERREKV